MQHLAGHDLGFLNDLTEHLVPLPICNNWVGWLCSVDRLVPEDIHNQVAIKLLVSGLLT